MVFLTICSNLRQVILIYEANILYQANSVKLGKSACLAMICPEPMADLCQICVPVGPQIRVEQHWRLGDVGASFSSIFVAIVQIPAPQVHNVCVMGRAVQLWAVREEFTTDERHVSILLEGLGELWRRRYVICI